ncbi:protein kinase domain-containing protein [Aeromonas bestiarum]|uniref:protein kinase domain-containing protein n=1 Tax=Aeromonas bestiarum TaxID=105751 RepID=UPI0005B78AEA|nr:serine/threonine protein kinase [Aeromonas bestiarum]
MDKSAEQMYSKPLSDEYGNQHYLADELARGGQGVVFRTKDADLAIKQPLAASGELDKGANLRDRFQNIRLLPMPARIPISLPLAILRDEPGYVMRLLSGMKPFGAFDLDGKTKKELEDQKTVLPQWLKGIPDKEMALRLLHYANTGSTHRRLFALSKCASILARLHCAGMVYGDISANNAFIGEGAIRDVWLIDADNMRFELLTGGSSVYTPGYGAPEVVRGNDSSRPRSDCWAFAVMAFKMLALCHPFIGKKVLEPDDEEGGWDAEPLEDGVPADLDGRAYAGYLPFVDDEDDDSNPSVGGLPRVLVATPGLHRLFQETFGAGRSQSHRRPVMAFWAIELTKAFDHTLECPKCKMSFYADDHESCPYCHEERPSFLRIKTSRWKILIPSSATEAAIPHRLFHPFSFEYNDDTEYEAVLDFSEKTAFPIRGTKAFPESLVFEFVGVKQ